MKKINVTISAKADAGKSYLGYELRNLLINNGWNVEFDIEESENEIDVDATIVNDIESERNVYQKIENVRNNSTIVIREIQLPRNEN